MPADIHLDILLPSIRSLSGLLTVRRTGAILGKFEALGRGSQGPGDTQMALKGNTPRGDYQATRTVATDGWSQSSYGPHGAIRLKPVSGMALTAAMKAGRSGILIHGGTLGGLNYWRGPGELRATWGCIRLRDHGMARLVEILAAGHEDPEQLKSSPYRVTVTVTDQDSCFDRP